MDPFPLPRINLLLDETVGCAVLSFMDAFRDYHQIFMHDGDEEKTTFITPDRVFCYLVMALSLRWTICSLETLLSNTMEAYVDDMLVKSKEDNTHAKVLAACFHIMKRFNLHLNPKKSAFAVRSGKFLGCMVTQQGIDLNPEKEKEI